MRHVTIAPLVLLLLNCTAPPSPLEAQDAVTNSPVTSEASRAEPPTDQPATDQPATDQPIESLAQPPAQQVTADQVQPFEGDLSGLSPGSEPGSEPRADTNSSANANSSASTDSTAQAEQSIGGGITDDARLRDLLSLVKDNTTSIHRRENPAYFELVKAIMARSTEQLQNETTINPRFNELYKSPDKYRGQLVHLNLNARKVLPYDIEIRNAANVTRLYEIWGWTNEAKAHMYCCIVPELPPGFPEEGEINKRVDLVGYFFKLQGYLPGNADPNGRNLVAPLIIGRVTDTGPVTRKANDPMGSWPIVLIIGFGTIVMLRLMMHLRGMTKSSATHRNYRRRSLEPIDPDSLGDALGDNDRGLRIRNASDP